jgi:hypothetical protein
MSASDQRHSSRTEKTREGILAAAQRLFLERANCHPFLRSVWLSKPLS